jgi:hypothetical protein
MRRIEKSADGNFLLLAHFEPIGKTARMSDHGYPLEIHRFSRKDDLP